jgi:HAD superfamily hydrolase (TIGR01509 family)
MIKAVIFDMDGVIIDSEPVHKWAMNETLKIFEIQPIDFSKPEYLGKTPKSVFTDLKIKYRLPWSVEELVKHKGNLAMKEMSRMGAIPGVVELIQELHNKGYKLVIGSGQDRNIINFVLNKFGIKNLFFGIISSENYFHPKPDPEVYNKCVSLLGLQPNECVVIEDAPNGVNSASAAGIKCVGFNNPSNNGVNLIGADIMIDNFKELRIDLIKELGGK